MKISKHLTRLACILLLVFVFTACSKSSSMSYTFDIENGDFIKVELNTSKGHTLKEEGSNFFVYKPNSDDAKLANGYFLLADDASWQKLLDDISDAKIIKEETVEDCQYIYFSYHGKYYCCVKLANCNSGVKIICASENDLNEVMSLLSLNAE